MRGIKVIQSTHMHFPPKLGKNTEKRQHDNNSMEVLWPCWTQINTVCKYTVSQCQPGNNNANKKQWEFNKWTSSNSICKPLQLPLLCGPAIQDWALCSRHLYPEQHTSGITHQHSWRGKINQACLDLSEDSTAVRSHLTTVTSKCYNSEKCTQWEFTIYSHWFFFNSMTV